MKRLVALGMASLTALAGLSVQASAASVAGSAGGPSAETQRIVDFWTPDRIAHAIPRDIVLDRSGNRYLRLPSGALQPYGDSATATPTPMGATDTSFGGPDPSGVEIGSLYTFRVQVTDPDNVKSVSFRLQPDGGTVQVFSASKGANNVWSVSLQFSGSGRWTWQAVAKDGAARGGNTMASAWWSFSVATSPIGSGTSFEAEWTGGGDVQDAAGRLFFEMPSNPKMTRWTAYVCSGTAVTDQASGRSLILTAAHCVYDDVYKVFARNVLFIPNQAATTASGSNRTCSDDKFGCWTPNFGVVHDGWKTNTPDNYAWDFGYYVVADTGKHAMGYTAGTPDALQDAVNELGISFTTPARTATYALGYSADRDPSFRYCTDTLTTTGTVNWWLASCGMTGGSSGGPWMQSSTGAGPIISVNSWGYVGAPGMAGAMFDEASGSKAKCTYQYAYSDLPLTTPDRGYIAAC